MKKAKLSTILLFSILPLLLISITACGKSTEPKKPQIQKQEEKPKVEEKTTPEQKQEPDKQEDVEIKVEEKKETEDKDDKKDSENKEEKDKKEKDKEENKSEEKKDSEKTEEKKETKDKKESKENSEKKETSKSSGKLGFSNSETKKLRDLVNKIGMTLIENDNQEQSTVPVEGLEAIATFDNKDSYGWICKYQDNKIGVAQIYKNSPIEVVRIFGEEAIFQDTSGLIENNNPEMYKKASERIENTFFPDGTKINRLY